MLERVNDSASLLQRLLSADEACGVAAAMNSNTAADSGAVASARAHRVRAKICMAFTSQL